MSLQVIDWPAFLETPVLEKSAMTVGVFDGVHLGHSELIARIVRRGPNPTVVTFRENPKKLVSPENYEGDIYSLKQKLAAFDSLGVSRVVLIDFSENFSKLNGWEFFELLEEKGKMAFLAIGSDFRCGYQQDTGAGFIREMNERKGIPTELVLPVLPLDAGETVPISSSRIRAAIISGEIKLAASLMGRNFELDLSDLRSEPAEREKQKGLVYDLRAVFRIAPAAGQFPVLMHPDGIAGWIYAENGKVFLSGEQEIRNITAESVEFIIVKSPGTFSRPDRVPN